MSQTHFVSCGDDGFWAYDTTLGVFLKHMVDAAESSPHSKEKWLSEAIDSWRAACVIDVGLTIEPDWSPAQREVFIDLAKQACERLQTRASISAEEIVEWPILDDLNISPRGAKEVATAPVIELGHALIALASGKLPKAPKDKIWFYTPDGRETLEWRSGG